MAAHRARRGRKEREWRRPPGQWPRRRHVTSSSTSPITSAPTLRRICGRKSLVTCFRGHCRGIQTLPTADAFSSRALQEVWPTGRLPVRTCFFVKPRLPAFVPPAHSPTPTHWVIVINTPTITTPAKCGQKTRSTRLPAAPAAHSRNKTDSVTRPASFPLYASRFSAAIKMTDRRPEGLATAGSPLRDTGAKGLFRGGFWGNNRFGGAGGWVRFAARIWAAHSKPVPPERPRADPLQSCGQSPGSRVAQQKTTAHAAFAWAVAVLLPPTRAKQMLRCVRPMLR